MEARLDTIYFTLCCCGRDECGKSPQWMVCISFREEEEEEKEQEVGGRMVSPEGKRESGEERVGGNSLPLQA